jgi:hypothetical protein
MTEFVADFCIASNTNYALTGSVQASANQDLGNITATGVVSVEALGTSMFLVNEEATNGQNDPISMTLPLSAGGCYEITVEVFADALPSGTGGGTASSSIKIVLSPQ